MGISAVFLANGEVSLAASQGTKLPSLTGFYVLRKFFPGVQICFLSTQFLILVFQALHQKNCALNVF